MNDVSQVIKTVLEGLVKMNHECTRIQIDMKEDLTITAHISNPLFFDREKFEDITKIKKNKVHIPEKILQDERGFVFNDKYIIIKP